MQAREFDDVASAYIDSIEAHEQQPWDAQKVADRAELGAEATQQAWEVFQAQRHLRGMQNTLRDMGMSDTDVQALASSRLPAAEHTAAALLLGAGWLTDEQVRDAGIELGKFE